MRSRVFPRLYQAGVRYRAEPRGQENWLDAIQVLTVKFADCEDLASYRAAELRVRDGVQARAVFKFWQNPATLEQRYHCLVHYTPPMGGFVIPPYARRIAPTVYEEDPSKLLGMRGAS